MKSESEFTQGANPLCPNDSYWSAVDEQGTEKEVSEFMYSLIRLIKPTFAVETGCYKGDATIAIAKAMEHNGLGQVFTCDIEPAMVELVNNRLKKLGLEKQGQAYECAGIDLIKKCGLAIDFAFIDSSPYGKEREAEIGVLIPLLKKYNMFLLHDTAPQHPQISQIPDTIHMPKVYFNTPRGLTLFQKL